jgi:4-methyl-5(b-hydroxyethyl)-thiazole monophosphate biosynthesis
MNKEIKAAVLLGDGFEEGEATTIIDILRRAGISCDAIGLTDSIVMGGHDIAVKADKLFDGDLESYALIVIPGGLPGATNLRDDDRLITAIQKAALANRTIAAICAGPIVLERAGLLKDLRFTAYPGYENRIGAEGHFVDELVVIDRNLITSRGPATAYAFAYALVEHLGFDAKAVKERMLYASAFPYQKEDKHA